MHSDIFNKCLALLLFGFWGNNKHCSVVTQGFTPSGLRKAFEVLRIEPGCVCKASVYKQMCVRQVP